MESEMPCGHSTNPFCAPASSLYTQTSDMVVVTHSPFPVGLDPFPTGNSFQDVWPKFPELSFPREISMDTSKRTKEEPMTFPEQASLGFLIPKANRPIIQRRLTVMGCSTNMPFGKKSQHGWIPCVAVSIMETLLLNYLKILNLIAINNKIVLHSFLGLLSSQQELHLAFSYSVDGEQAQQAGRYART